MTGLGRGLDALIPGAIATTEHEQWLDWLLGLDRRNQLTAMRRFLDWRRAYRAAQDRPPVERQTWIRSSTTPRGVAVTEEVSIEVNDQGKVRLDEAFLARLLHEAGWERTA